MKLVILTSQQLVVFLSICQTKMNVIQDSDLLWFMFDYDIIMSRSSVVVVTLKGLLCLI